MLISHACSKFMIFWWSLYCGFMVSCQPSSEVFGQNCDQQIKVVFPLMYNFPHLFFRYVITMWLLLRTNAWFPLTGPGYFFFCNFSSFWEQISVQIYQLTWLTFTTFYGAGENIRNSKCYFAILGLQESTLSLPRNLLAVTILCI